MPTRRPASTRCMRVAVFVVSAVIAALVVLGGGIATAEARSGAWGTDAGGQPSTEPERGDRGDRTVASNGKGNVNNDIDNDGLDGADTGADADAVDDEAEPDEDPTADDGIADEVPVDPTPTPRDAGPGCARFDVTGLDEIATPSVLDDRGNGEPEQDLPADDAKERVDVAGPVVALIVDRSRTFEVDRDAEPGEAGSWHDWDCDERNLPRCGATLISPEWLLTAAHCVSTVAEFPTNLVPESHRDLRIYDLVARIGSVQSDFGGHLVPIVETIVHPDWATQPHGDGTWSADVFDMRNDVALLRLAEPVSDLTPAQLTTVDLDAEPDFVSFGWGLTDAGPTSALHGWQVTVADNERCIELDNSNSFVPEAMVCTDEVDGSGTCLGDSGGPLAISSDELELVGVTGFVMLIEEGRTCGDGRMASFTLLTDDYLEWIDDELSGR